MKVTNLWLKEFSQHEFITAVYVWICTSIPGSCSNRRSLPMQPHQNTVHSRTPFQSEAFRPKDSITLHGCERSQDFDTPTQAGRQSNWLRSMSRLSKWLTILTWSNQPHTFMPSRWNTHWICSFSLVWPMSLQDTVLKLFLRERPASKVRCLDRFFPRVWPMSHCGSVLIFWTASLNLNDG